MANYQLLKADIDAKVYQNGAQEITGANLNSVLNAMVTTLGAGYQFMGVATPTNPGTSQTPDYKCFYLATTPGTYTNLGGLVVADGEVAILKYDTSWTKVVTGIASADQLNQLGEELTQKISTFGVITLKVVDNGGIVSRLSEGEYGFNLAENKIILKKQENASEQFTPTVNGLFRYNGKLYRWDGSALVFEDATIVNLDISAPIANGAIRTNVNVGDVVNLTPESDSSWEYQIINISDTDSIILTGFGANAYRLWAFVDADNKLLSKSKASLQAENLALTIPTTATKLIVNSNVSSPYKVVKQLSANDAVEELSNQISDVNQKESEDYEKLSINDSINSILFEQGGINIKGSVIESDTQIHSTDYINGFVHLKLKSGYLVNIVAYYNPGTKAFDSYEQLLTDDVNLGRDNLVFRFSVCKSNRIDPISVSDVKQFLSLEYLNENLVSLKEETAKLLPQPAMVRFEFDHEMKNFDDFFNNFSIQPTTTIAERVYRLYDELVALYPDYVKKYDPMAEAETTETINIGDVGYQIIVHPLSDVRSAMVSAGFSDYPVYARGVQSPITETIVNIDGTSYQATYDVTPAYKTYMYQFVCGKDYINTDLNKKYKALVTSNLHGNEVAAVVNLYLVMKQLCSGVIQDPNFYKLRAAFDFYVVPSVNQYGNYHGTRCNARRVDLNRNFPIANWYISGFDTIGDDNYCVFTGPNAGSEFETQLVVALTNYINPDWAFDHHNHGDGTGMLYSGLVNHNGIVLTRLAQQAGVDIAIADGKNYPEYFGTSYHDELFGATADAPGHNASINLGRIHCWWAEFGVKMAGLIEMGTTIEYTNGEKGQPHSWMQPSVFSIGEYMVKIQWLRYMQFLMENYKSL